MTREEIIDELCRLRSDIMNTGGYVNRTDAQKNRFAQALSEEIQRLQTEPCEDCISRQAVLSEIEKVCFSKEWSKFRINNGSNGERDLIIKFIKQMPSVKTEQKWIPVSKRLPKDLEPVNITWVNREPEPYYHDIKDKNFVATGIHYRGQWYWYSTTCADYLGEYGSNEIDLVDDAIEILAWMPLPEPFKAESEDENDSSRSD